MNFTTDVGTLSTSSGETIADGTTTVTLTNAAPAIVTATTGPLIAHASVLSAPAAPGSGGSLVVAVSVTPGYAGSDTLFSLNIKNGTGIPTTAWSFGDGGSQPAQPSTSTAHTYAHPGAYAVTAIVTDPDGQTTSATTTATITTAPSGPAPTPTYFVSLAASAPSVLVGGSITLTAAVTAINGAPTPTSYAWDCQGTGTVMPTSSPTHSCTYTSVGPVAPKVTATGGSLSVSASTSVNVTAPPPPSYGVSLAASPAAILINTPTTVTFTATATPQNGAPLTPTSYAWTFGDATLPTTTATSTTTHVYSAVAAATFSASVTVTGGTASGSAATSIVAAAAIPVITVNCPSNWMVGIANTCNISATLNSVVVPSVQITSVSWDFGNGMTTTNSPGNVSPPNTYTAAEMFTIVAVATVVGGTGPGTGTVVTTVAPM